MKKIILATIIISTIIFTACNAEQIETDYIYDENIINNVQTTYVGDTVQYEVSVNKPTPCHEIQHEARMLGTDTLEILIAMESTAEMCAQVITPETITDTITVISPPSRVIVQII